MKNNKGFTLIELLAIVIILAVIMVVAAPSMTREIKRGEEESGIVLNQKIENAAHLYAAKYYANKIIDKNGFSFTLNDLEQDGLLNLNGKCKVQIKEEKKIKFNGSDYSYTEIKSTPASECYTLN